jgi:hypothetical protein
MNRRAVATSVFGSAIVLAVVAAVTASFGGGVVQGSAGLAVRAVARALEA